MSERSDWSGELLERDRPALVTVTLEDGTRRLLQVSGAEHEQLAEMGEPATGQLDRLRSGLRRHGWKAARWIAAAAVAAFITQYVTTYYADREQAMSLKTTLATTISGGAVRAHHAGLGIAGVGGRPALRGERAVRAHARAVDGWSAVVAEVDPLVFVHFKGTGAEARWERFDLAVYAFLDLARAQPPEDRATIVDFLRDYFAARGRSTVLSARDWALLACSEAGCGMSDDWRDRYWGLGSALMTERGSLTEAFLRADAENLG